MELARVRASNLVAMSHLWHKTLYPKCWHNNGLDDEQYTRQQCWRWQAISLQEYAAISICRNVAGTATCRVKATASHGRNKFFLMYMVRVVDQVSLISSTVYYSSICSKTISSTGTHFKSAGRLTSGVRRTGCPRFTDTVTNHIYLILRSVWGTFYCLIDKFISQLLSV